MSTLAATGDEQIDISWSPLVAEGSCYPIAHDGETARRSVGCGSKPAPWFSAQMRTCWKVLGFQDVGARRGLGAIRPMECARLRWQGRILQTRRFLIGPCALQNNIGKGFKVGPNKT